MKKLIVAVSLAASVMTLGACSEKTEVAEKPKTFTKAESEQEALKTVKTMFKHLDAQDTEKLKNDFDIPEQTFVEKEGDKKIYYDIEDFVNKFSDNQYGSHTKLSIIPKSDWSQYFKKDKKSVENNHKVLVLAKYDGKSFGNYSLVIPVEYNEYQDEYQVGLVQTLSDKPVQIFLEDEAFDEYIQQTFPIKVSSGNVDYSNDDNYFADSLIRKLVNELHKNHSDIAGNYLISIRRMGANQFLLTSDKEEMIVEFKDLANMNDLFDWQITRNGTGEVLLQSDTWE